MMSKDEAMYALAEKTNSDITSHFIDGAFKFSEKCNYFTFTGDIDAGLFHRMSANNRFKGVISCIHSTGIWDLWGFENKNDLVMFMLLLEC